MKIRFYIDIKTNNPHIYKHEVSEKEIIDFFSEIRYFELERSDGSFEGYGKLKNDRFLQVAYRKEDNGDIFVITAYDIVDKETMHLIEDNL